MRWSSATSSSVNTRPAFVRAACASRRRAARRSARNDARKRSTDYGVETKGAPVVDLRDLADAVHLPGNRGLADLVATALKCLLPKPARTRTGDWEAYPLTAEQRDYAALDAYASFRVFSMLAARASPTALGDVTNRAADSVPPVLPAGETPPESQQELE